MGLLGMLFFAGAAVATVAAWLRMRARDQKTLAQWHAQEEDLAETPEAFHWEDHVEDPDAWKGGDSEP